MLWPGGKVLQVVLVPDYNRTSPFAETTIVFKGISTPAFSMAFSMIFGIPEQQGTSITMTVTDLMPSRAKIWDSFST